MAADVNIKPTEGKVAIRFIGDDDDEDEAKEHGGMIHSTAVAPEPDSDNEAEFAIVVGVGDKVPGIKAGDTVIVRKSAKCSGIRIGDVRIVDAWYLQGKVVS